MDVVDAATRSRMMSGIRGRDTEIERLVRSLLHRRGFRFRLHVKELPGHPDIALPRLRAVVLVHGCFWHGHDCPLFRMPSTRPEFWNAKITQNRANDERNAKRLADLGWRAATVWECALRGRGRVLPDVLAEALAEWLHGSAATLLLRSAP